MKFKYFKFEEFDSPDVPGSGVNIDPKLVEKLDWMREQCGFPFVITSGVRTPKHNKKVKGAEHSAHLISEVDHVSHAVDIACPDSHMKYKLIRSALVVGITRIGIGKTYIHVDNASNEHNTPERIWVY